MLLVRLCRCAGAGVGVIDFPAVCRPRWRGLLLWLELWNPVKGIAPCRSV